MFFEFYKKLSHFFFRVVLWAILGGQHRCGAWSEIKEWQLVPELAFLSSMPDWRTWCFFAVEWAFDDCSSQVNIVQSIERQASDTKRC